MSLGARWTLGVATFLFGCGFAAMYDLVPQNKWITLVFAAICWLISFACTPLKGAGLAGRIIAGIGFLLTLGYVVEMAVKFYAHPTMTNLEGKRSESTLMNALILFGAWGLPAGIYAASGVWTKWRGKAGSVRTAQGELEGVVDIAPKNDDGAW